ncbi:hypothetical protein PSCFBP2116_03098 [Pseudomonas syringae]|uniref:Uncharacterized protein n=1 Tax=Pseudomonas syringae TaxID=317 RepID=A0A2K4WUC6_PSESX|nr:hypothetical protein CFBP3840_02457 [Pseudomonas syringae]SPD82611.1 hypothetical protein PSCFBP2116_03098 [Pseudomonas syringae]
MHQRQAGFFQFVERYPTAELREHKHLNGKFSTVGIGLSKGYLDCAFLGVYHEDGSLKSEENLPWDFIEDHFGQNIGTTKLLENLAILSVAKVGAPIQV